MACIRIKGGVVCATLPSELADPAKPPEGYSAFFDWVEHWRRRPHPFRGDPNFVLGQGVELEIRSRCWTCGRRRDHKLHGDPVLVSEPEQPLSLPQGEAAFWVWLKYWLREVHLFQGNDSRCLACGRLRRHRLHAKTP